MALVTGIEIDDRHLKVVQGESEATQIKVNKFFLLNFTSLSQELPQIVSSLKKINISSRRTILFIPRTKFSVHYVSFPTQNPEELNEMAKFRAKRQLLYTKEEIMHGFRAIGRDGTGTKTMLLVVRETVVQNYLKVFNEAKINPTIVTINALGLANWFELIFPQQNKDICLVDLDNYSTVVSILNRGKLVFSREVNKGWEQFKGDDSRIVEIASEIQYTISAYEKEEFGPKIQEFLVTGVSKGREKLAQALQETLGKEIRFLSPLEKFNLAETEKEEFFKAEEQHSLAKVLGCFSSEEDFEINLISKIEKKPAGIKISLPAFSPAMQKFLVYLWFFLAVGFIFFWEAHRQKVYLYQLRSQFRLISKRIESLEEKQKIINLILDHLRRPASFLEVFKELTGSLPPQTFLQRLDFRSERNELKISGFAGSSEEITRLLDNLQNCPLFKNVNQKYVRAGREGYTFQIDLQIK
ncbi:MAG: pilus assembly protein PilM [Candidatus Omnitrophica bacterium]|nr:pilus assembly protein PilM [Candidatus Omnitrophota bacterium]MCM8793705.1 pilus assembly protein PilM [Candidatus Omnitrophota bacterium]